MLRVIVSGFHYYRPPLLISENDANKIVHRLASLIATQRERGRTTVKEEIKRRTASTSSCMHASSPHDIPRAGKKRRSTLHSMHDTARTQLGLYINSSPHRPLRSIKQHCSISSFTISPDRLDSYCAGKKWSLLTSLFGFGCIQFHCACLFKLVIKTRGFVF